MPFEQEMKTLLEGRGFKVRSHSPSGACLTGLVIEGEQREVRLVCESEKYQEGTALEEEINRLAVLERIGWEMVYVSASRFYQNPEVALNQLVDEIQEKMKR